MIKVIAKGTSEKPYVEARIKRVYQAKNFVANFQYFANRGSCVQYTLGAAINYIIPGYTTLPSYSRNTAVLGQ